MVVKELIEMLSKFDSEMKVLITSTDTTDYTYINDVNGVSKGFLNVFEDGESFIMDELDDSDREDMEEGVMNIIDVLVIDGGEC